ncbi:hypothetical protein ACH4UV_22425 [Streptomyces sp. NPDC020802]|uniref:hypothetical protein n=1 Tax=Streptomyces sp. NPDC020802 TaxID=3365094 RepID=UPI0037A2CAB7
MLPRSAVARTGPGPAALPVAPRPGSLSAGAGAMASPPERLVARWTLTTASPERDVVPLDAVAAAGGPAAVCCRPVTGSPEPVAAAREEGNVPLEPPADAAGGFAGRGPVGALAGSAAG